MNTPIPINAHPAGPDTVCNIIIAFRNIFTVLGIAIGIAAIVSLSAVGKLARVSIEGSVGDLATNLIVMAAPEEEDTPGYQCGHNDCDQ